MDGIIIINKPKNFTSHDIVYKVKKTFHTKVGHTGTLDPQATGVLPLLLGNATKISKYLINHDKTYEVILKLGIQTDTLDEEGTIINEIDLDDKVFEKVDKVFESCIGKQKQIPPMYSAIKINGKKLYEYARQGKQINVPEREIQVYNINLQSINKKDKEIKFKVNVSKGTYIRTLCSDIAKSLGTIGYMKQLNRLTVRKF